MKLFNKKTVQIIAFLGLILGVTPKAKAIDWQHIVDILLLGNVISMVNPDKQIIYEKNIQNKKLYIILERTYTFTYYLNIYHGEYIGWAKFTVDPSHKEGYLSFLEIEGPRSHGYGALLYACVIEKMIQMGCEKIEWLATPLGVKMHEKPALLPQLVTFYEQLGAKLTSYNPYGSDMELTNLKKAKEGIYKILEKWELKDLENSNNTQALQRAAAIVNHIAPK